MNDDNRFKIPKTKLHSLNEKRRDIDDSMKGTPFDSYTRMHGKAKASGMDKALFILGYEWKDNRYQHIEKESL